MPPEKRPAPPSPGSRPVSIVDVAASAGVSRQTVSNVLNGRRAYFSVRTQERVLAAMAELGYQPNRAAQSLRSRRSMQIGYHMFGEQLDAVNAFFQHFLQALVREAARDDYQIVVFTHHEDEPLQVFRDLVARRDLDAVILSESAVDDPRVRVLAEGGMPFASFGRLAPDLPQNWVDVDNVAGMQPLVDHLVARGHEQFSYVGALGTEFWKEDRLRGLAEGLARHGLALPAGSVHRGDHDTVRARMRRLLTGPHRPSAIVCDSDAVAAVVLNVAHSVGLRPGHDVAVTGFDGGAIGQLTEPTLTSVRIPVERIARELVDRCRLELDAGPGARPGLIVPTEVVVGGSA